jgi:hypothetical protein
MITPMPSLERVTVTLPADVVEDIDRRERNRSRFILEAVRRELLRRRRDDLKRSLHNPHPETDQLADAGFEEWGARLTAADASELIDKGSGRRVRWVPGKGWTDDK